MSDTPTDGVEQRDPEDNPFDCSLCGCYLGSGKRLAGEEYCDACAREIGVKPPLRRCMECGQRAPEEQMKTIDVSPEDEYYPEIAYLCRGCSGGESS